MATKRIGFLQTHFYFGMSLLIALVVIYGFSFTIEQNLIHPTIARPTVLYIHAAVFSGWLIFLILQSGLVRTRNIAIHRSLGFFGVALGGAILVLGLSAAITMARFNRAYLHATHVESDLIVQFFDMISFTIPFALAIHWRKRTEFHRRLILIASCVLTSAAFGRFPHQIVPSGYFYAGVDLLIFLGVARDLIVSRRVHITYTIGLPVLIFAQILVTYASAHESGFLQVVRHILD